MYCLCFPREGSIPRQASPCLRESRILVRMMSRSHSEITACSRGTVPGHPDRLPALWLHFLSAEAGLWTQKCFPWVLGWQFSSCRAAWGLEPGTWSSGCDTECGNRCILEGELWASCAPSLQSSPRLLSPFLLSLFLLRALLTQVEKSHFLIGWTISDQSLSAQSCVWCRDKREAPKGHV